MVAHLARLSSLAAGLLRFVGPKVLVGALGAMIIVLGLVVWRWQAVAQEAAGTQQQIAQYQAALAQSEQELRAALQEQSALSEALAAQRQREKAARERARRAESALVQLEEDNEDVAQWTGTGIPRGIRDWLRDEH